MRATTLLSRYPLISDQVDTKELSVVLEALESQLRSGAEGNIVEFGCYIGTTSLFIRRLLDIYKTSREFHVYDSFVGLPDKGEADKSPAGEQFKRGELAVSKKEFLLQFKKAGLRPPVVHKAWFSDIEQGEVPDGISFAFLDGDYYESVMTPLTLIWEKCLPGAMIIVDDYANEALPGAAKAVDDWLRKHPANLRVQHSLAIISLRTS
jgi:O-methyltransferase